MTLFQMLRQAPCHNVEVIFGGEGGDLRLTFRCVNLSGEVIERGETYEEAAIEAIPAAERDAWMADIVRAGINQACNDALTQ